MRRIVIAGAIAAAAAAPSSGSTSTVALEGEVESSCVITGEGLTGLPGTVTRTVNLSNPQSIPSVNLYFQLACLENFKLDFIPQNARFENIDAPSGTLQAATVGDAYLEGGVTPSPDFVGGLKYTLNAVLGGVTLPAGGGGPSYTSPSFGPGVGFGTFTLPAQSSSLTLTFDPVELPASLNLLAGEYNERIVILLTPQGV